MLKNPSTVFVVTFSPVSVHFSGEVVDHGLIGVQRRAALEVLFEGGFRFLTVTR